MKIFLIKLIICFTWSWFNQSDQFNSFKSIKGQLISKAIYGLLTSPKKRTDEFVLFAFLLFTENKSNSSVHFLRESTARKSAFWNKLTFNILLTSSNNQISEFRIPSIYNEILFILLFAWSKVGPTVSSVIYNPL